MQRMYVITANEGQYLTQAGNLTDQERDYVTEISTANPNEYENWRDATEEEFQQWSERMAEYEAQQQEVEEQGNE